MLRTTIFYFSQVISPVTGRVIGSSELRVVRSKERVAGLRVRLVTGLNLAVTPHTNPAVLVTRAEIDDQLLAKYQVRDNLVFMKPVIIS